MSSIGVVGYGRLGKRLINHLYRDMPILCLTKTRMENTHNIRFTQNPQDLTKLTHIFIAIKPKDLLSLKYKLSDSQFLISPMAGVDIDTLRSTYLSS